MDEISTLMRIEFEGLPPTVNQMYRTGSRGQRYKKPEVAEWQEEISAKIKEAWSNSLPYEGEVSVSVIFTVSTKRRWDIDNRLKALFDCLQSAGVIKNDSQISGIMAGKNDGDRDCTSLEVREY